MVGFACSLPWFLKVDIKMTPSLHSLFGGSVCELVSKTIHSVYRTLVAGGCRTEFLTSSLAVGWWWFSAAKISLCSFASNTPSPSSRQQWQLSHCHALNLSALPFHLSSPLLPLPLHLSDPVVFILHMKFKTSVSRFIKNPVGIVIGIRLYS